MISVKNGVQPILIHLISAVANVAQQKNIELRITSGIDGKHSEFSGHYQLRCIDVGSKEFQYSEKHLIRLAIELELKKRFDSDRIFVDLEHEGQENEHIHVQFK